MAMHDYPAMLHGPGKLRFIIQPIIAILLGLRDGRADALAGKMPFLLSLVRSKARETIAREALKQIAIPLCLAVIMDCIFQYVILRSVLFRSAVAVGAVVIALPYSICRALTNRVVTRSRARRTRAHA